MVLPAGRLLATGAVLCALTACTSTTSPDRPPQEQVVSPIRQALDSAPPGVASNVWQEVRRFYERRADEPLWTREPDLAQAAAVVDVLQQAPEHGLATADYLNDDLAQALTPETPSAGESPAADAHELARLDVRLTSALLALGHDVAVGRTKPETIDAALEGSPHAPRFRRHSERGGALGSTRHVAERRPSGASPVHPRCRRRCPRCGHEKAAGAPAIAHAGSQSTSNDGGGCPMTSAKPTSSSTFRPFTWSSASMAGRRST